HVHEARPRFRVPDDEAARLSEAFHRALVTGDAAQFAAVLAADAVLYSDRGGKRAAALNPIHRRDPIVRFFAALARGGSSRPPAAIHRVRLGGLPGVVFAAGDGTIDTILTADVRDGQVVAIYAVRNPDKLAHVSLSAFRSASGTH